MKTITNKILINDFNTEVEYYFGFDNNSLISKSDTDEQLTSGSVYEETEVPTTNTQYIFNLNINKTDTGVVNEDKLKQYSIKNIIIYLVDGDISNNIDKNLIHNGKPPKFTINKTEYTSNSVLYKNNGIEITGLKGERHNKKLETLNLSLNEITLTGYYIYNFDKNIPVIPENKIIVNLKSANESGLCIFKFGIVFEETIKSKIPKLFEYNQINNKVNKLMAKRDLLIDKDATNQTIKKARQLIKKKIEFHKYWIDKLYNITFYTHLILVLLLFILLFYKLL